MWAYAHVCHVCSEVKEAGRLVRLQLFAAVCAEWGLCTVRKASAPGLVAGVECQPAASACAVLHVVCPQQQAEKMINGTKMYTYEIQSDKRAYLTTIGKKGKLVLVL